MKTENKINIKHIHSNVPNMKHNENKFQVNEENAKVLTTEAKPKATLSSTYNSNSNLNILIDKQLSYNNNFNSFKNNSII